MKDHFELDDDARSVLAAGRDAHAPTDLERARVRRAVQIGLAAGTTAIGGPRAELPSSVKFVGAAAVAGAVAGGAWYAHERPSTPRPTPATAVASARPAFVPLPEKSVAVPLPSESPQVSSALPTRPEDRAARAPSRTEELAAEIALLAQVNSAINGGQAEKASALLREYDRRYSPGVLREERAAAGVLALCAAGRVDAARSAADRFEKRWPRSPLLARIGGSCAGSR
jgi:hypothetical protein